MDFVLALRLVDAAGVAGEGCWGSELKGHRQSVPRARLFVPPCIVRDRDGERKSFRQEKQPAAPDARKQDLICESESSEC